MIVTGRVNFACVKKIYLCVGLHSSVFFSGPPESGAALNPRHFFRACASRIRRVFMSRTIWKGANSPWCVHVPQKFCLLLIIQQLYEKTSNPRSAVANANWYAENISRNIAHPFAAVLASSLPSRLTNRFLSTARKICASTIWPFLRWRVGGIGEK